MKKILLIFVTVLLSSSVTFAASELIGLTDFLDVEPGSWYEKAVAELQEKKIIQGYEDGTFKPEKEVNRAELSRIISRALSFMQHPAGIEPWKKYINKEFSFAVDYPPDWKPVEIAPHAIGFRPPGMAKNSVQWAVIAKDNDPVLLGDLIAEMGKGYPDTRAETRQDIIFNGKIAKHAIVTTTEKPKWRYEQIFIPHFNKLYVVTNGAIENSDFELFWRSLKFLKPQEPGESEELGKSKQPQQPGNPEESEKSKKHPESQSE